MKVILTTESGMSAIFLKRRIISAVRGEIEGVDIETWSHTKSRDNFDILFHNVTQYVNNPEKNVLFRVEVEDTEVVLSSAWWTTKPKPSNEMISLHIGRLTEMLLVHFSFNFIRFGIVDF